MVGLQFASENLWGPHKGSIFFIQFVLYCPSQLCSLSQMRNFNSSRTVNAAYMFNLSLPQQALFIKEAGAHFLSPQSFQHRNTLFPCLIKHTNKLSLSVNGRFTAIPLCWQLLAEHTVTILVIKPLTALSRSTSPLTFQPPSLLHALFLSLSLSGIPSSSLAPSLPV